VVAGIGTSTLADCQPVAIPSQPSLPEEYFSEQQFEQGGPALHLVIVIVGEILIGERANLDNRDTIAPTNTSKETTPRARFHS
jgi:hypothetical protein